MRRLQAVSMVGAVVLVLSASACRSDSREAIVGASSSPRVSATPGSPVGTPSETPPKEITAEDFDPNNFDDPTNIDNEWFPLRPGTQLVYEGHTVEDGERLTHRVVFTVTDLTKVIDGVRTVVIWDRDYSAGHLEETELAFFAQDRDGNVWHLGQYPEEYEEGKLTGHPAWIAGWKGARPGIAMKTAPRMGAPSYSQGYAPPPINWVDHARVYRMGQETCVPFACYEDVLVTEEFEPTKPGAFQLKYYARGVGNVRVGWRGKDDQQEILLLVKVIQLGSDALEKVRADAMELEKRAYRVSKGVYGHTPPAEHTREAE